MQIVYRTKKLEKVCSIFIEATKAYGLDVSTKLHQRVQEIISADSVEFLLAHRIGRCHLLHGKRNGQYAMDLGYPYRLVFEPYYENLCVVRIIEIVDYH